MHCHRQLMAQESALPSGLPPEGSSRRATLTLQSNGVLQQWSGHIGLLGHLGPSLPQFQLSAWPLRCQLMSCLQQGSSCQCRELGLYTCRLLAPALCRAVRIALTLALYSRLLYQAFSLLTCTHTWTKCKVSLTSACGQPFADAGGLAPGRSVCWPSAVDCNSAWLCRVGLWYQQPRCSLLAERKP